MERLHRPTFKRRVKAFLSRALRHSAFASLWTRTYDAAYARSRPATSVPDVDHLLVTIPSGGSLGDQAMVEAFLEHVPGTIGIVARGGEDVSVPAAVGDRVSVIALPELFTFVPFRYVRALPTFKALVESSDSVSVLGADVMDGGYSVRRSIVRAQLARLAARDGRNSRVLGFSWNGHADDRARRQLALAHHAGVRLFARDPVSLARLHRDGMSRAEGAADLAFAGTSSDDAAADRWLAGIEPDRPIALVNVSGLIARRMDQIPEYRVAVKGLQRLGFAVVLLPHDDRPDNDDVAQCRRLSEALSDSTISFVDRLPTTGLVRSLARRATVTISGRMHLAILSLQQGTPTVALSTQGKVEGLMQLVGTPGFAVAPVDGFGARLAAVLDEQSGDLATIRARIVARRPEILARALSNFGGLSR